MTIFKPYKLTKKMEMDKNMKGIPYYYDDGFISNGAFIVRKFVVKDYHKFCEPTQKEQPNLTKFYSEVQDKLKFGTRLHNSEIIIKQIERLCNVFYNNQTNNIVLIDNLYVNAFNLIGITYLDNQTPVGFDNGLIMPITLHDNIKDSLLSFFNVRESA